MAQRRLESQEEFKGLQGASGAVPLMPLSCATSLPLQSPFLFWALWPCGGDAKRWPDPEPQEELPLHPRQLFCCLDSRMRFKGGKEEERLCPLPEETRARFAQPSTPGDLVKCLHRLPRKLVRDCFLEEQKGDVAQRQEGRCKEGAGRSTFKRPAERGQPTQRSGTH